MQILALMVGGRMSSVITDRITFVLYRLKEQTAARLSSESQSSGDGNLNLDTGLQADAGLCPRVRNRV